MGRAARSQGLLVYAHGRAAHRHLHRRNAVGPPAHGQADLKNVHGRAARGHFHLQDVAGRPSQDTCRFNSCIGRSAVGIFVCDIRWAGRPSAFSRRQSLGQAGLKDHRETTRVGPAFRSNDPAELVTGPGSCQVQPLFRDSGPRPVD
jgi:hypothetical protein